VGGVAVSNPGVIYLVEKNLSDGTGFRVEDNLGESIHLHYSRFRVDLSIKQFLCLADTMAESVNNLLSQTGFRIEDYDINFLNDFSYCLSDLEKIEKTVVAPCFLRFQRKILFGIPVTKSIERCVKERSYKDNGLNNDAIILFNDSPVVMYGENEVLKSYQRDKNKKLHITRFIFVKDRHSVCKNPWAQYFFLWNKKRIYKLLKYIFRKLF
jgi:hypothetical protein